MRHYTQDPNFILYDVVIKVGRCRLTVSEIESKARLVFALSY